MGSTIGAAVVAAGAAVVALGAAVVAAGAAVVAAGAAVVSLLSSSPHAAAISPNAKMRINNFLLTFMDSFFLSLFTPPGQTRPGDRPVSS
jgi:hypothetical protein